jgi:hypothetical protein
MWLGGSSSAGHVMVKVFYDASFSNWINMRKTRGTSAS